MRNFTNKEMKQLEHIIFGTNKEVDFEKLNNEVRLNTMEDLICLTLYHTISVDSYGKLLSFVDNIDISSPMKLKALVNMIQVNTKKIDYLTWLSCKVLCNILTSDYLPEEDRPFIDHIYTENLKYFCATLEVLDIETIVNGI